MTVGEKIKMLRTERGITQKQLGEKCGIAEPNIRKYELGKQNPKIETVKKIADALGVSLVDVMGQGYWDKTIDVETIAVEVRALETVQAAFGKKACDIISDFSQLNKAGQEKAADYVSDLVEQPKYQKPPE